MRDVWFTSDTHFGHTRILDLCSRPFSSVEEMDAALIERWNERVKPGDTVWHLGDVALGPIDQSLSLVGRLNGSIILVAGNHDRCSWAYTKDERKRVEWVKRYRAAGFRAVASSVRHLQIPVSGIDPVWLSHFPYEGDSGPEDRCREFRPKRPTRGTERWLIHGHVHNGANAWTVNGRQINVGVDVWDYAPVHLDTVRDIITNGMPPCMCAEWAHHAGAPGCALNGA